MARTDRTDGAVAGDADAMDAVSSEVLEGSQYSTVGFLPSVSGMGRNILGHVDGDGEDDDGEDENAEALI